MTLRFAKAGQFTIPIQAVVGSTITLIVPITAVAPEYEALREALKSWVALAGWDELPDPDDFTMPEAERRVWRQTRAVLAATGGKPE